MTINFSNATTADTWHAIDALDLSNVAMRLQMQAPEGEGWTPEQAAVAISWYKRFLKLGAKYPELAHVPNWPIDEVWHKHILDTAAYRQDCENIFGRFIDHYPYFGLRGDETERDLAFDETNRLYRLEFGEDCLVMRSNFDSGVTKGNTCTKASGCNHAGSGTGCGQHGGAERSMEAAKGAGCNHAGSGTGCGQRGVAKH